MRKFICILFILFCVILNAQKIVVSQVYNPKKDGQNCFVSDVDCILSSSVRADLNSICLRLEQETGVEFAIVIVPSIQGDDEYTFAYDLFNSWHIGKEGKNNGLLWLYVVDIRAMKFETGYGLEGLLPDAYLNSLLDEDVFPLMRKGEVDKAYTMVLNQLYDRLTTEDALEELLLESETPRIIIGELLAFYFTFAFLVLILLAIICYRQTQNLICENNVLYCRLSNLVFGSKVLAFIFPLPILFFYWYILKQQRLLRTRPMVCSHCGGSMRLLSEADEDRYLNFKQQAEERVKSIDYDVWKCNVCDNYKVLPYEKMMTKYQVCPQCGAKTYSLVSDRIIFPATSLTTGRGEKVHECANCHCRKKIPYVIPIIVVSRGGNCGGGFSKGSFGGGFSGGGGAGGRF
jgi:uncharacterized protein